MLCRLLLDFVVESEEVSKLLLRVVSALSLHLLNKQNDFIFNDISASG
jgi:hypothetical protein